MWECDSPKCLADNKTIVDTITLARDDSMIMYLGKCTKCGNFNKRFTMGFLKIHNQLVSVSH